MDELRDRLQRILSIGKDAIRLTEHRTFNRLLYKNRNQHRRGLYFRRLEHVRRLLRDIGRNVVWESIRHALGGAVTEKGRSRQTATIAISSLTLEDLQSAEGLLTSLVAMVIPTAALKVTTELISRQHFVPFAVSIIATLSRIFVMEQKLLSEVRGAIVEAKLLLNASDVSLQKRVRDGTISHDTSEDVGHVVQMLDESTQDCSGTEAKSPSVEQTQTSKHKPSSPMHQALAATNETSQDYSCSQRVTVAKEKPSLYDIMTAHNASPTALPGSNTGIQCTAADTHRIGICSSSDHAKPGEQLVVGLKRHVGGVILPSYPHQQQVKKLTGTVLPVARIDVQRNASTGPELPRSKSEKQVPARASNPSSSDSDELDDIFDALEE